LQGQDLNLQPSRYKPNIFGGFLPTNRGDGQMVGNPDKPNSWWKLSGHIIYTGWASSTIIQNVITK